MVQLQRSLIESYFDEKILSFLAGPLLKWYLDHGLIVTRVYQVVEYIPNACFLPYGEAVFDARRTVDIDSNKSIIADIIKLVGSSSYGKAARRALNWIYHYKLDFLSISTPSYACCNFLMISWTIISIGWTLNSVRWIPTAHTKQ